MKDSEIKEFMESTDKKINDLAKIMGVYLKVLKERIGRLEQCKKKPEQKKKHTDSTSNKTLKE